MKLALALLVGCGPGVTLDEVPIRGGTAAQRVDVRAQLLAFDEASGRGRVTLREVRLVETEEYLGAYDAFYRRIDFSDARESYAGLVQHEVCHALLHQEALLDPVPSVITALEEGLFTSDRAPGVFEAEDTFTEAVASFCEMGPVGAMVAATLPDGTPALDPDPLFRRRLATWLLDTVWTAYREPAAVDLAPAGVVSTAAWSTLIRPSTAPNVVGDALGQWLDLYSGAPVGTQAALMPSLTALPPGVFGVYAAATTFERAGVPGGASAFVATWDLYHLGAMRALVAADGGVWHLVEDGSVPAEAAVFTADGQVWIASREDGLVVWTSVSAAFAQ